MSCMPAPNPHRQSRSTGLCCNSTRQLCLTGLKRNLRTSSVQWSRRMCWHRRECILSRHRSASSGLARRQSSHRSYRDTASKLLRQTGTVLRHSRCRRMRPKTSICQLRRCRSMPTLPAPSSRRSVLQSSSYKMMSRSTTSTDPLHRPCSRRSCRDTRLTLHRRRGIFLPHS